MDLLPYLSIGNYIVRFLFLFCLTSSFASAAIIEKTLEPQVTIIKNTPSDALKITIKQSDFTALYSVSSNTFRFLDMPFTVQSVNGTPLDYTIALQTSQHYCQGDGQSPNFLSGVTTTLNGTPFMVGDPRVVVPNSIESNHVMRVVFPSIQQKVVSQVCYGTFVITAELKI